MSVPTVLLPSQNRARTATPAMVTGAASASHPLANIANGDVTLPFIADTGGTVRIAFDCGAPVLVDALFLPMHNIAAALAGVKFEGHPSNTWGAPDFSVTLTIPPYRSMGLDLPAYPESYGLDLRDLASAATRTRQWWSLLVPTFGGSPATVLAIGELLFGPLTDLWGFSPDDNSEEDAQGEIVKEAAFGKRWAFRYGMERRRLGGTIVVTGEERDDFIGLYREVGTADPFIWMPDPDGDDVGLLVTFEKPIPRKQLAPATGSADSLHQIHVDLREVGRGLAL